jgi:UDP-N-acetylmuramate dehydrogenase
MVKKELLQIMENIKFEEPLKDHTTIRIGGKADFLAVAQKPEEVVQLVTFVKEKDIPIYILGNGSNIIVSDDGFRGLVLKVLNNQIEVLIDEKGIAVYGGFPLPKLVSWAVEHGYGGIEELAGIPGTIGGSVVMNAGARGREIGELVQWVRVLHLETLKVSTLTREQLNFSYRKSVLQNTPLVVLEVKLNLYKEKVEYLKEKVRELLKSRKESQPINFPNAGSTFKNPPNFSAGMLIEKVGLKGYRIGDAQISEKHGNFIVNLGEARAVEVMELINLARKEVYRNFGIKLEPEVKFVGGGLNLEEV